VASRADPVLHIKMIKVSMMTIGLVELKCLSDSELLEKTKSLAARERGTTALLIAHLAELDTRDVLLREGYSSLFAYCREVLGLSDHEALNRIEVARAARRFPAILDMLVEGRVNLTAVRLLAPHLNAGNFERVLAEARGKRTEEIRAMAGGLAAASAAPPAARPIAAATPEPLSEPGPEQDAEEPEAPTPPRPADASPAGTPASQEGSEGGAEAPRRSASPDRRAVILIGPTLDKLRLAKDLLRHALPSGDENEIVDRALALLLADLARTKFADTDRPRRSRGTSEGSRHVPAEVKRAVWLRDLGRCAYVGTGGHRCEERGFLEFHHVKPFEVGGGATVENIQLRCGRHNRYEAKVYFRRHESGEAAVVRESGTAYGSVTPGTRSAVCARFKTSNPSPASDQRP
jgi:hypothetical protein